MKFSLLFSDASNPKVGKIGSKTLYHLQLDKSFERICISKSERQYFSEILSAPLLDQKDILFRQSILSDFLRSPALFDEIKASLNEFEKLKENFKCLKKEIHARNFGIGSSLGGSKESVKDSSRLLKRVLDFVKKLNYLLDKHPISAEGLQAISGYVLALTQKEDMDRLIDLLHQAEALCLQTDLGKAINLNANGKIAECHLIDPQSLCFKATKPRRGLIARKESTQNPSCVSLQPPTYSDCQTKLGAYPYLETENLLTSLIAGLLDTFGELNKEIQFYSVAVDYVHWLTRKKIPFAFPTVGESTQLVGAIDLYLATVAPTESIIPNDFAVSEQKGSIIFGDNGNGKTVLLRTVSTCQILAQTGMPIPAKGGAVGVFTTIKTQFSESEDVTASSEKMGRFEQEVSELSELIDTTQGGSLLILNEIFQTTAYSEGAIGLYHILNYLSAKSIGWILVSHLTDLNQYFKNQDISIYEMTKEHKIVKI